MRCGSDDTFPAPVFKDTVLGPLFESAKANFVDAFRRIDRAHCVMLAEAGILTPAQASSIARALFDIERTLDLKTVAYTGEVEDLFFLIEHALKARLDPDTAGRLHTGRSRNDIDHTIFKIVLKQRIDTLLCQLRGLLDALISKATADASTVIAVRVDGELVGTISVADTIKPSSDDAIARLRALGLRPLLLTGDENGFMRFLRACAARTGQMVNLQDLCRDVDLNHATIAAIPTGVNYFSLAGAYHRGLVGRAEVEPKML